MTTAERPRFVSDSPTLPPKAVFSLLGVSEMAGYSAVRNGEFALSAIRVSRRRFVFARRAVRDLLGVSNEELALLLEGQESSI